MGKNFPQSIEMTVLLFDIDNTLLDFDKAEYDALGKILSLLGHEQSHPVERLL